MPKVLLRDGLEVTEVRTGLLLVGNCDQHATARDPQRFGDRSIDVLRIEMFQQMQNRHSVEMIVAERESTNIAGHGLDRKPEVLRRIIQEFKGPRSDG